MRQETGCVEITDQCPVTKGWAPVNICYSMLFRKHNTGTMTWETQLFLRAPSLFIWCVVNSFRPKYCLLFTYNGKHPLFSWHQLTTHYLMLTKEAEVCLPSWSQLYNRCLVRARPLLTCCVQIYPPRSQDPRSFATHPHTTDHGKIQTFFCE